MITVYHLENSRSQRILWMLEEMGVDYDVIRSERDPKTLLGPAEQKKVHPLGKWPVIVHNGKALAESGAIVEYLIGAMGQGRFKPQPATEAHLDYLYWLHFAEASLQPNLFMNLVFSRLHLAAPALIRPIVRKTGEKAINGFIRPRIMDQMKEIDTHLEGRDWFAGGEISGADIMMIFPLEAAMARTEGAKSFENVLRYVKSVHARPAYQASLRKGGPYAYASVA